MPPAVLSSMCVALFQADGGTSSLTKAERLAVLEERLVEAAAQGAQLLVVPECFADAYPDSESKEAAIVQHLESACAEASLTSDRVSKMAAKHGISVIFGHMKRGTVGPFENAASLIEGGTGRTLLTYSKMHTGSWHPESCFSRGQALPPVVTLHGIKVAVVICYDMYFPELCRHLKRAHGVQLVVAIWASTVPQCVQSMSLVRAIENEIAVISVDYADPFEGGSCYVDDMGQIVKSLGKDEVSLAVVQVDIHDVRNSGRTWNPIADLSTQLKSAM